jgi:hypothetical protein
MGLFDRFKRQRDPDELEEELGRLLVELAPHGFAMLWARCFMLNGTPDVTLFIQTSGSNPAAIPLALTDLQVEEVAAKVADLWQACKAARPEPWTSAAFTISGEGEMETGFSYEPVTASRLDEFKQKWERRFLPGGSGATPPSLPQPAINEPLKILLDTALSELKAKSAALDELCQLSKSSWSLDQGTGTIRFQGADGRSATSPFQAIGTINTQTASWLWAWENPSIAEPLRQHALVVRAFGEQQRYDLLTTRTFPCDEELAWRLTALAAREKWARPRASMKPIQRSVVPPQSEGVGS